jgi:quercetin dioxygenase-like cupin family protein
MSPMQRPISEPTMTFDLQPTLGELRSDEAYARSGRSGRTLARSGRLRVVLVALNASAEVGTHQADSPMTVHVLEGRIGFRAGGESQELSAGQVLFFGPGEAHDIRALEASALLLTISAIGEDTDNA